MSQHDLSNPGQTFQFEVHAIEQIKREPGSPTVRVSVVSASGDSGATRFHLDFPVEQIVRVQQMLTVLLLDTGIESPTRQ